MDNKNQIKTKDIKLYKKYEKSKKELIPGLIMDELLIRDILFQLFDYHDKHYHNYKFNAEEEKKKRLKESQKIRLTFQNLMKL